MTNRFISPNGRPFMSELKRQKEAKINSLINNLKIGDVKDDMKFSETSSRIKNSILLKKVEFGEPKCTDHEYEDRPLSMQQQLIGASRQHYIHTVEFPYTGDSELFDHMPESGFSFSNSDHGLIIPYHDRLTVYVDLPELNPTKAIAEARSLLSLTMQFVNSNNASIENWSQSVIQRIDQQMQQKREELIKLFG